MSRHVGAAWLASVILLGLASTACNSVPPGRTGVDAVEIVGADEVDEDDIAEGLATQPSPKFLGLFQGVVYDRRLFNRATLQTDLARVERYYQSRGYYEARARAGRVVRVNDDEVRVEIIVTEGRPTLTAAIALEGGQALDPDLRQELREIAEDDLPPGEPFDEEAYEEARLSIKRMLHDAGYAYATVEKKADVDIVQRRAEVVFKMDPDEVSTIGEVHIDGDEEVDREDLRDVLALDAGDPYSIEQLEEAQQAAFDLGIFASVTIEPVLSDPPPADRRVPIQVTLVGAKPRTLQLGGGIGLDAIKSSIHALIGWEHRRFLGGIRKFSAEFRPALVLHPLRINNLVAPEEPLPAGSIRSELRQYAFLEGRTTGFVQAELSASPVLLRDDAQAGDTLLGYLESKGAVGVDRKFWRLFGRISYNAHYPLPFTYVGELNDALGPLLMTYPELFTTLDLRDDSIHPTLGVYLGNRLQTAFLGDARDIRIEPEVRAYVPIGSQRFVLAGRVGFGFLFPQNYGQDTRALLAGEGSEADRVRQLQLLYFRGLYAGGPSSNRGYAPNAVGPHGVVPYLLPQASDGTIGGDCDITNPTATPDACKTPVGGSSRYEASLELRIVLVGPLSTSVFCDIADVSVERVDIRLQRPHLSCGSGLRYDTPVGPIRLDVGYRIPGAQVAEADPLDKDPGDIFGAPIAIALAVGEAF